MLAERLRLKRKERKLTQEELAQKVNTTKATISNYENGYSSPSNDMLVDLAKALNTTTDYLLGLNNKENKADWNSKLPDLTEKDEKDIAKRMEKLKKDLMEGADNDGLNYLGEPLSKEAIESLLDALEYAERQTTRVNKKYTPKKYRKN